MAARSPSSVTARSSGCSDTQFTFTRAPRIFYVVADPAALHARQLHRGADRQWRCPLVPQLVHSDDPGDDHPDPDGGVRSLRPGLDALPVPRPHRRGGGGPPGGAAADVADPAADDVQQHRQAASAQRTARPISASGWRTLRSACRSPSICCATTWPACPRKSWSRRASTAPRTSRSSPAWCCR